MRYAILSDVHANLQALDAAIADACQMGAEAFVSLGDVVGYGPLPAGALNRVRNTCAIALAGNHDDAVSGRMPDRDFVDLAADAVARHRDALDANAIDWLKSLPYTAEIEGAWCVHGDLIDPPKFFYVSDEADAGANFLSRDFTLAFVGHTHEPSLFLTGQSGTVYKAEPQDFTLENGKRYIVNVGSVGYPRESGGLCRSSYVLYDSNARTVEFRFLPFAVSSVMERGRGPKTRWKLLAALGAPALAILTAAVLLATLSAPKDNPALVLAKQTIVLKTDTRELHANIELARKTGPANLRIRFYDGKNRPCGEQTITIRQSSTKNLIDANHTIPAHARAVQLTVLKTKPDDPARIDRFDPQVR